MAIVSTNSGIDANQIETLPYVELMALLQETNRPPGGLGSLLEVRALCNLLPTHVGLDVGCNTGFVAFELAALTGCRMIGIDLSEAMVTAANARRAINPHANLLSFRVADAHSLPFDDAEFDFVICGGSLPFMAKPSRVVREMHRVVRPGGFLISIDFFYKAPPPPDLLADLSRVLGFRIKPRDAKCWRELFDAPGVEPVLCHARPASPVEDRRIGVYVESLMARAPQQLSASGCDALRARLLDTFRVFNRNHEHLSVLLTICRRAADGADEILFA